MLFAAVLLSTLALASQLSFNVTLAYSAFTPPYYTEAILSQGQALAQSMCALSGCKIELLLTNLTEYVPEGFSNELQSNGVAVVIDATFSLSRTHWLGYTAASLGLVHLVIGRALGVKYGEKVKSRSLFCETTPEDEVLAYVDVIARSNWTNLMLIYNLDEFNDRQARLIKSELQRLGKSLVDELVLDPEFSDEAAFSNMLSTTNNKARVFVVFTSSLQAKMILKVANEKFMGGVGYVWLLNSQALEYTAMVAKKTSKELLYTGGVGVAPTDFEEMKNPLTTLSNLLSIISKFLVNKGDSARSQIYTYIKDNSSSILQFNGTTGVKSVVYNVFNVKDGDKKIINTWTPGNSTVIQGNVTWPGGENSIPIDTAITIRVGFYAKDCPYFFKCSYYKRSAEQAFDDSVGFVNSKFPGLNLVKCKGSCIKRHYDSVLAIVSDVYLETAYGKPVLVYDDYATNLTSAALSVRTAQPVTYQAAAIGQILKQAKIKRIGVIYTNDDLGKGLFSSFKLNLKVFGLSIENDEDKQVIEFGIVKQGNAVKLTDECKKSVERALRGIVEKQLKVIVYLGNELVTAELAKVGHSKELDYDYEYLWVGGSWLTPTAVRMIEEEYADDIDDIYRVLNHSIGLDWPEECAGLNSVYGHRNLNSCEALRVYNRVNITVTLLGMAIYDTIQESTSYTNATDLHTKFSQVDFTNNAQKIKIKPDTNEISTNGWQVVVLKKTGQIAGCGNYTEGTLNIADCYNFITKNHKSLEETFEDTWDEAKEGECDFPRHMIKLNTTQWPYVISFIVFMVLLIVISAIPNKKAVLTQKELYCKRDYPNDDIPKDDKIEEGDKIKEDDRIEKIEKSTERSWRDTLVMITCFIEFCQMLSFCPPIKLLQDALDQFFGLVMIDVVDMFKTSKQTYWDFLIFVELTVTFYLFSFLLVGVNNCFKKSMNPAYSLNDTIERLLCEHLIPLIGNTLYFPIVKLMLDSVICDQEALGRVFVRRDCYMECWKSDHVSRIVFVMLTLALYLYISTLKRAEWQTIPENQNVKITKKYIFTKTIFQISFVLTALGAKGTHPEVYAVVFFVLITGFCVLTYFMDSFNYEPFKVYQTFFVLIVTFLSALGLVGTYYPLNDQTVVFVIAAVLPAIAIAVLFVRRRFEGFLLSTDEFQANLT
mmetsp:Transcript_23980/g.42480  ORF Transcript_23980/g.42480 Transcript_23980/m.42480 type:complete len:1160 (+) Transcript_23980:3-3482(+)